MTKVQMVDTRDIVPGPNDRTVFSRQSLEELASNIKDNGLIQPITVRWVDEAVCYEIVAGERRFRACKDILGWDEIPSIVKDLTEEQASAVMLAENVSRENLDPIDEGRAYASRMTRYGWSEQEVASHAGVSVIRVRFRLKLLSLRDDVQGLVRTGNLSIGYAQILADSGLDESRQMVAVRKLRDNKRPTPGWFRGLTSEMFEQQAQMAMFDLPLMGGPILETQIEQMELPPTPSDTKAPAVGSSPREIIANQSGFWSDAASAWDKLGKPFKRQECEAASMALQAAMGAV
jgi:ParB/RepB/Spo0J family partition protein